LCTQYGRPLWGFEGGSKKKLKAGLRFIIGDLAKNHKKNTKKSWRLFSHLKQGPTDNFFLVLRTF
jgi:hypothetical protein